MQTIFELKEQAVTDTPLLLFDCTLPGGQAEYWSTHAVTVGDGLQRKSDAPQCFRTSGVRDQGIDGVPRISLVLANADSTVRRSNARRAGRARN